MATCPIREGRAPIRPKLRSRETSTFRAIFRGSISSRKPPFSDIVREEPAPIRRGPGSYQYRVKLERRGPAGLESRGAVWGGGAGGAACLVRLRANCAASFESVAPSFRDGQKQGEHARNRLLAWNVAGEVERIAAWRRLVGRRDAHRVCGWGRRHDAGRGSWRYTGHADREALTFADSQERHRGCSAHRRGELKRLAQGLHGRIHPEVCGWGHGDGEGSGRRQVAAGTRDGDGRSRRCYRGDTGHQLEKDKAAGGPPAFQRP